MESKKLLAQSAIVLYNTNRKINFFNNVISFYNIPRLRQTVLKKVPVIELMGAFNR